MTTVPVQPEEAAIEVVADPFAWLIEFNRDAISPMRDDVEGARVVAAAGLRLRLDEVPFRDFASEGLEQGWQLVRWRDGGLSLRYSPARVLPVPPELAAEMERRELMRASIQRMAQSKEIRT